MYTMNRDLLSISGSFPFELNQTDFLYNVINIYGTPCGAVPKL